MKKYRHRITGDWVEKANDHFYRLQTDGRTIPVRFIEGTQDWQEMPEKVKYGDYVRMNDRFETVHIWSKELEEKNAGRFEPLKITKEEYEKYKS